jgi:hypothetical protein
VFKFFIAIGYVLYALLVLALADWTGTADVRWPWKEETKTNRWDKEAVEQAKLELERIQQKAKEARRTREEEERRLAKLKEEQELIEAKSREEERKLKLAQEQRQLEEQKLREAEQGLKETKARRIAQEHTKTERIKQGDAAERRRQEKLRLASIIDTEIKDKFNRAQIQQILQSERIGTSWKWKNDFTNNIIFVTITGSNPFPPCLEFKISLVGKYNTQVERVKKACRGRNDVWKW